jgi:glycosyltransferase involved in cell wall biosynthesis
MKKVLIIGPYPPLYSYGGPTRSIYGLNKILSKTNFCTVLSPRSNLNKEKSNIVNTLNIIYSDYPLLYFLHKGFRYNIIWANTFFDFKIIIYLLGSHLFNYKLIISPRGQLSSEAIKTSNPVLKNIFIRLVSLLTNGTIFHVTSKSEKTDLQEKLSKKINCVSIPNLFSLKFNFNSNMEKKFIFYSRIHKKKGLHILLNLLLEKNKEIHLDIYGFIEDKEYWEICNNLIMKLKNVNYVGELIDGDVTRLKNQYTFFILPTLNENFGHVIVELMSIGLIPILSKNTTPFDSFINKYFDLNFDLSSEDQLLTSLNKACNMSMTDLKYLKESVFKIYKKLDSNQKSIKNEYINFVNKL